MRGLNKIVVESFHDPEALFRMEGEWRSLWSQAQSTPFQSPDWILPWWREFGTGDPYVVSLRIRGELVGLAPFYLRERRLLLIGTGNSDYLDFLVHPEFSREARELVFESLEETKSNWDCCDFQQVREDSPLRECFARRSGTVQLIRQEVCPVLDLHSNSAGPMLDKARAYRSKLESSFGVKLELASSDSLAEDFPALLRLHKKRWRQKGMRGALEGARERRFHEQVVAAFHRNGMLRFYVMRASQDTIAALYGFHLGDCTYYYLSGFDPALAHYSPGTVIVAHAIEEARREGARWFDFLRGAEPYKYRWGASDRINFRGLLWKT